MVIARRTCLLLLAAACLCAAAAAERRARNGTESEKVRISIQWIMLVKYSKLAKIFNNVQKVSRNTLRCGVAVQLIFFVGIACLELIRACYSPIVDPLETHLNPMLKTDPISRKHHRFHKTLLKFHNYSFRCLFFLPHSPLISHPCSSILHLFPFVFHLSLFLPLFATLLIRFFAPSSNHFDDLFELRVLITPPLSPFSLISRCLWSSILSSNRVLSRLLWPMRNDHMP